jgi:NitT/TauT family transport system permease protein
MIDADARIGGAGPQSFGRRRRRRIVAAVATVLVVWYIVAFLLQALGDPLAGSKLPFPHVIVARMISASGTLADAAWSTASRAVLGFAIGSIVSLAVAVVMVQARWLEASVMPLVLASQLVPPIALVPILRSVLKDGDLVRLYVASFVTFFIVTVAALRGLKSADREALELMASLNASRWKTLRYVRLPAALPYLFSGLRVAAPLSIIGAILVDLVGARNGLGYLMVTALSLGGSQIILLWAALVVSLAIGLLFTRVVAEAERRATYWHPSYRDATP